MRELDEMEMEMESGSLVPDTRPPTRTTHRNLVTNRSVQRALDDADLADLEAEMNSLCGNE